jgi:acetyltransferase-like isoleucine patch superfamily enzyme
MKNLHNNKAVGQSNKWQRLLRALPGMVNLFWLGCLDHVMRLYVRASWKLQGLSIASTAELHYQHREQVHVQGKCSVGPNSMILVLATEDTGGSPLLTIGDRTYIGDQVNLRAAGGAIKIGRDVLIANQVTIVASNHGTKLGKPMIDQEWRRGDVVIEDDVWIGAGVVVLPGTIIRRGAVIGAGAVVHREVPVNTIYGGIPARQIGIRS